MTGSERFEIVKRYAAAVESLVDQGYRPMIGQDDVITVHGIRLHPATEPLTIGKVVEQALERALSHDIGTAELTAVLWLPAHADGEPDDYMATFLFTVHQERMPPRELVHTCSLESLLYARGLTPIPEGFEAPEEKATNF